MKKEKLWSMHNFFDNFLFSISGINVRDSSVCDNSSFVKVKKRKKKVFLIFQNIVTTQ